jgi:hypothetical protein
MINKNPEILLDKSIRMWYDIENESNGVDGDGGK